MNILKTLLNFSSNPVGVIIDLALSVGKDKLEKELKKAIDKRISVGGRATVASRLSDASIAIKNGNSDAAAKSIVALLEGIK